MESLPRPAVRTRLLLVVPLAAALCAGCVTTDWAFWKENSASPCLEKAFQVVAVWNNSIGMVPDPTKRGQPSAGFVGRVYLFGTIIKDPLVAEGSCAIDLFDESTNPPKYLERWEIDPETFGRLVSKDFIGWGYTVFLPSKHWHPAMSKIRMRTCFKAKSGTEAPIYTENAVTLSASNGVLRESTSPLSMTPPASRTPTSAPAAKTTLPPPIPVR